MILASASPRRVELMARAGYHCRVVPADIDESRDPDEPAVGLVARLARAKALAVLGRALPNEIVVAADTVVAFDGRVLGKPRTEREAASMLPPCPAASTTSPRDAPLPLWTDRAR